MYSQRQTRKGILDHPWQVYECRLLGRKPNNGMTAHAFPKAWTWENDNSIVVATKVFSYEMMHGDIYVDLNIDLTSELDNMSY